MRDRHVPAIVESGLHASRQPGPGAGEARLHRVAALAP
jgi:hypothetical protein